MKNLIVYASTHGAAAECARRLSLALGGETDVVDLNGKTGADPSPYDTVVVGSSVYAGKIQKNAGSFCRKYESVLLQKPLGIFFSSMSQDEKEIRAYLEVGFPQELVKHLSAYNSFGGAFYFSRLNFAERTLAKMIVRAMGKRGDAVAAKADPGRDFVTISDERIAAFARQMKSSWEGPDQFRKKEGQDGH